MHQHRPDVQVDPFIHGSAVPHVASLCLARHCVACAREGVRERVREGVGEGEKEVFFGSFWFALHRIMAAVSSFVNSL